MRAVVSRVFAARVEVAGQIVGQIERGTLALVGIGKGDSESEAIYLVDKIVGLRIFEDDRGKMSRALADIGGGLLLVSQFTLYGDVSRGRRPGFDQAMAPEQAEALYDRFVTLAQARHPQVEAGRFRANMKVIAENDGPVTLILDTAARPGRSATGAGQP